MKLFAVIFVSIVGLVCIGGWYWKHDATPQHVYRTVAVKRGDMTATISATGTVEPQEVVDVGAQTAGIIDSFGKDPADPSKFVDYDTRVEQGTVLAHIDESLYQADVDSAQAQLDQAKANVTKAQADLLQMKAKLDQASADWTRAQEASPGALSKVDIDAYRAAYQTAQANVGVGDATIVQTQKAVAQAEAALKRAMTNLGYCTIRSPVKGVVIDRRVNMGQTVVSSLNAPSLFLIAKDLTRMQVWASVNEADIGAIHIGQPATFTVDAFPGRTFKGTVGKIRLNATMTQNVVTYTVEVETDNTDGKLLPYLTANVLFETQREQDVLQVPTTALRWSPHARSTEPNSASDEQAGAVWVSGGDQPRRVVVKVLMADGGMTAVQSEELKENDEVIVGEATGAAAKVAQGQATNPFVPQIGRARAQR